MSQTPGQKYPLFNLGLLQGDHWDEFAINAEWERAFGHFQPRLVSYFERRTDGIFLLDDLLQEVWLRAFLNVKSLESGMALWTWLITIGNNLLRDELRRKRPIVQSLTSDEDAGASSIAAFIGIDAYAPADGLSESVEEMRAKLTEDDWEFLNLLCVDNCTHEEVARRLGIKSAMASRQRLRRIRQRLLER
jgi:RNA polymerase sigma factor (sigma-70 family)